MNTHNIFGSNTNQSLFGKSNPIANPGSKVVGQNSKPENLFTQNMSSYGSSQGGGSLFGIPEASTSSRPSI